ncbi:helix-turn-helix transcriptional regulator [Nocardia sp. NRRL S-836]|uniref:helix-turn-helix transcriptional regulator n=1 Tax=Nocardia sp. NRRL S-836 TaxID=1519492 RepID=UPI00350F3C3F
MAGYTQESLAEKPGVDRASVQRWHAGKSRPQAYLWPKLAKLLDVSPQRLRDILAASEVPGLSDAPVPLRLAAESIGAASFRAESAWASSSRWAREEAGR